MICVCNICGFRWRYDYPYEGANVFNCLKCHSNNILRYREKQDCALSHDDEELILMGAYPFG